MSKELQKYGTVDVAAALAERERLKTKKNARGFLKLEEGMTSVRMAPPWRTDVPLPIKSVWIHGLRDPGDLKVMPRIKVPCNAKNHSKSCGICKEVNRLRKLGGEANKELAFQWSSQERFFASVVNTAKLDDGWLLWEFGPGVYDDLLALLNPDVCGDFTNPDEGYNLSVERSGQGLKTKYKIHAARRSSKFPKPDLLSEIPDLDYLAAEVDLAEMARKMKEAAEGEDDSEGGTYVAPDRALPPASGGDAEDADFEDQE